MPFRVNSKGQELSNTLVKNDREWRYESRLCAELEKDLFKGRLFTSNEDRTNSLNGITATAARHGIYLSADQLADVAQAQAYISRGGKSLHLIRDKHGKRPPVELTSANNYCGLFPLRDKSLRAEGEESYGGNSESGFGEINADE